MNALQFFRLLAGVNARILRRHVLAVREKSFFMVSVITLFVVGYWFAGYTVFFMGFHRLGELPGMQGIVVDRMLYMVAPHRFVGRTRFDGTGPLPESPLPPGSRRPAGLVRHARSGHSDTSLGRRSRPTDGVVRDSDGSRDRRSRRTTLEQTQSRPA